MGDRRRQRLLLAPLTAALFAFGVSSCTTGAEFPKFSAPVVDDAGVVSDSVEQAVGVSLEAFRASSGPQIAFAVIGTTGSASIEDYSIDLARNWGVGDNGRDDGVLVVIAVEDHKMRIEVGSGVEGDLTDLEAAEIIDQVMIPRMRADDVNGAVTDGAEALMRVWRGEPMLSVSPSDVQQPSDDAGPSALVIVFGAIVFGAIVLAIFGALAGGGPTRVGGSRYYSGYPSSRSYGGGSFGGGFSGGGGGGFSGGGASGSW